MTSLICKPIIAGLTFGSQAEGVVGYRGTLPREQEGGNNIGPEKETRFLPRPSVSVARVEGLAPEPRRGQNEPAHPRPLQPWTID